MSTNCGCSCCSHVLQQDCMTRTSSRSTTERNNSCLGICYHSFVQFLFYHQVNFYRPASFRLILVRAILTDSVPTGLLCLLAVRPATPTNTELWSVQIAAPSRFYFYSNPWQLLLMLPAIQLLLMAAVSLPTCKCCYHWCRSFLYQILRAFPGYMCLRQKNLLEVISLLGKRMI